MADYAIFARLYDLFYDDVTEDIDMYRGFAERAGGRVLEVGCGTGRVAIPLAQAGHAITGIDNAGAMLDLARRKARDAGVGDRAAFVEADMRRFELGARFDLAVIAINTFLHNLTLDDQLATLTCIRRHLTERGLLVIDVFNPDPGAPDDRRLVLQRVRPGAAGQPILQFVTRSLSWETQTSSVMHIVDEPDERGFIRRTVFLFELRFVHRHEAELLLGQAGYAIEAVYGSCQLDAFGEGASRMILVARPASPPAV